MKARKTLCIAALLFFSGLVASAQESGLSEWVMQYVSIPRGTIALVHAKVIDGTGSPAKNDQTILISGSTISQLGPSGSVSVPPDARVVDLTGKSVFPGIIGMHEHLYFTAYVDDHAPTLNELPFSFPRLYLAGGVTTIRTAGALEAYTDLALKAQIDDGNEPGPSIFVTSPLLDGPSYSLGLHLKDAADATRTVRYWNEEGITWFKIYNHITPADAKAVIEEAHAHGAKVTGHLCSLGYTEAINLGIDNIEHGFLLDSEFNPRKTPGRCPPGSPLAGFANLDLNAQPLHELIQLLVQHHIAVTSTLPVFADYAADAPPVDPRVLQALAPGSRASCLAQRKQSANPKNTMGVIVEKEMKAEKAFADAGGLLVAGIDPTGDGCVIAGYADQREIELLVKAGFRPEDAIRVATHNGATFLGIADSVGTIEKGKRADLVVVSGDPTQKIEDIENVEVVFKAGTGFDPAKLTESVKGVVGLR
jgi:imidazolonepropionase-like amidohydrolase